MNIEEIPEVTPATSNQELRSVTEMFRKFLLEKFGKPVVVVKETPPTWSNQEVTSPQKWSLYSDKMAVRPNKMTVMIRDMTAEELEQLHEDTGYTPQPTSPVVE